MLKSLEKRYRQSDGIVARKIGGEFVMVPISKDVGDLSSIYVLNEVAARIWELLDGKRKSSAIVGRIVEEYQVAPETAEADVLAFLQLLENNSMIRWD